MQRAKEEQSPLRNWEFRQLPKDQRPDYRLGFAIGEAMVVNGFQPQHHPDPLLDLVLAFIAAGHFVRPWREYGLTWSVLQWLQYLTQVTLKQEMGSIAGDLIVPVWDIAYRYRFFIWADAHTPFKIDRLAIELCNRHGDDLLAELEDCRDKGTVQAEYDREYASRLMESIVENNVARFSLKATDERYPAAEDSFWGPRCHERPPLPHCLANSVNPTFS